MRRLLLLAGLMAAFALRFSGLAWDGMAGVGF